MKVRFMSKYWLGKLMIRKLAHFKNLSAAINPKTWKFCEKNYDKIYGQIQRKTLHDTGN